MNGTLRVDRKAVAWKDPHADWPVVEVPYTVVAGPPPMKSGDVVIERERRAPQETEQS